MPFTEEAHELHLGAKRDMVVYAASMTGKTAFVEAQLTQWSKHSDAVVITGSV
jgi:hypothetical protein